MSQILLPQFDNDFDYFDMACKYELEQDKHFDNEVMFQIDKKLGVTTTFTGISDGQLFCVEDKGLNLNDNSRNQFWYKWVCGILRKKHRRKKMDIKQMSAVVEKLNSKTPEAELWAFITVGFDDEKLDDKNLAYKSRIKHLEKLCYNISHLVYEKGAIKQVQYVIEKHRATGIHHHAHFLFTFNTKVPPSTMINKIFAAKGVAEYVRAKNFIDYIGPQKASSTKPHAPLEIYRRYILGDKKEEKLLFVEKDREWRTTIYEGLQHIYIV